MFAGIESGMQFVDQLSNAFADKAESDWVAQQYGFNAKIATLQSQEAIQQGQVEGQQQQEKTAVLSGEQKSAEAGQGVDINTGTPEFTRLETSEIGSEDYATIINNSVLKSLGYQLQGAGDKAEGILKSGELNQQANQQFQAAAIDLFGGVMKAVGPQQAQNNPESSGLAYSTQEENAIFDQQNASGAFD